MPDDLTAIGRALPMSGVGTSRWQRHFLTERVIADAGTHLLIERAQQYEIVDAMSGQAMPVIWAEYDGGRPIRADSLYDGSFAADLDVVPDIGGPRFHLYWLYPYDTQFHLWVLNAAGQRIGATTPTRDEARFHFASRLDRHPGYLYRLLLLEQEERGLRPDTPLLARVDTAAVVGSHELAFLVTRNPDLFEPAQRETALQCLRSFAAIMEDARSTFRSVTGARTRIEPVADLLRRVSPASAVRLGEEGLFARCHALRRGPAARCDWEAFRRGTSIGTLTAVETAGLPGDLSVTFAFSFAFDEEPELRIEFPDRPVNFMPRLFEGIGYLHYVLDRHLCVLDMLEAFGLEGGIERGQRLAGIMNAGDAPPDYPHGFGYSGHPHAPNVAVLPDPYFFESYAYAAYRQEMVRRFVPWHERQPAVLWRGTTTGAARLTTESVGRLPRHRMCELVKGLGAAGDCGFTGVVQAASAHDAAAVMELLRERGLARERVPQEAMIGWRFLLDIDGNANSWGLFNKLLTGSCVLKVMSPNRFHQWYYDRLRPWEHYVPVHATMNDLIERIEWCLAHDEEARAIGERGRALALGITFAGEMQGMARMLATHTKRLPKDG